jgi:hypothetical protein
MKPKIYLTLYLEEPRPTTIVLKTISCCVKEKPYFSMEDGGLINSTYHIKC